MDERESLKNRIRGILKLYGEFTEDYIIELIMSEIRKESCEKEILK